MENGGKKIFLQFLLVINIFASRTCAYIHNNAYHNAYKCNADFRILILAKFNKIYWISPLVLTRTQL